MRGAYGHGVEESGTPTTTRVAPAYVIGDVHGHRAELIAAMQAAGLVDQLVHRGKRRAAEHPRHLAGEPGHPEPRPLDPLGRGIVTGRPSLRGDVVPFGQPALGGVDGMRTAGRREKSRPLGSPVAGIAVTGSPTPGSGHSIRARVRTDSLRVAASA